MPRTMMSGITERGVKAVFRESIATAPNIWQKHSMEISSDAPEEKHAWLGMLPPPRELISGRNFNSLRDFTWEVKNKTYELSLLWDRETYEDDRTNSIMRSMREIAGIWAVYKDQLFATLCTDGETSTDVFDGVTFHATTRTIGASANIDNTGTLAITAASDPSSSNILTLLKEAIQQMARFTDDQGNLAYAATAMQQKRLICPPEFHKSVVEAVHSTQISSSDNPWAKDIVAIDVLPQLALSDSAMFLSAVGSPATRMPFMHQSRTPLEIVVLSSTEEVAKNDGLMVLCRERFRLGYGEPRFQFRSDTTTTG